MAFGHILLLLDFRESSTFDSFETRSRSLKRMDFRNPHGTVT